MSGFSRHHAGFHRQRSAKDKRDWNERVRFRGATRRKGGDEGKRVKRNRIKRNAGEREKGRARVHEGDRRETPERRALSRRTHETKEESRCRKS